MNCPCGSELAYKSCCEPIVKGKTLAPTAEALMRSRYTAYALAEIEKATGIQGIPFEGKTVVLKEQVASFFEVTPRTVDNYLEKNASELQKNGYEVLKGNRLKEIKLAIQSSDVNETDFVNINKTPQLGIFDFRAFLNLAIEHSALGFPDFLLSLFHFRLAR